MAKRYAKNIITKTRPFPKEIMEKMKALPKEVTSALKATRLLWLDDEVAKGAFYMEGVWVWGGSQKVSMEEPHIHDFDEIIGFIGTNRKDPHDLGGEVELWLDDEKHMLKKSCFVFIPKGLKHCPLLFRRIDSPIFWFTIGNASMYTRESK
jgi:hypothetical protein